MPKFTVEYKTKSAAGFTHSKQVAEAATDIKGVLPSGLDGLLVDDLEFLVIRQVKARPEPKLKEVKK